MLGVWVLASSAVWCHRAVAAPPASGLAAVAREQLCVTEGSITPAGAAYWWSVDTPKMRAYVNGSTTALLEARFIYLGSTGNEARLGSGELRRQLGLKLRAQDACNLVYAMWRIEPQSKLVVSVKRNPGQHTSAECGNRGYRNIKPRHSAPVPALSIGAEHTLRGELSGEQMRVFVDNALVWDGSVAPDALDLDGPVGVRSDNARLNLALRAGLPLKGPPAQMPACRTGSEEAE
jgi:hypothetical protein